MTAPCGIGRVEVRLSKTAAHTRLFFEERGGSGRAGQVEVGGWKMSDLEAL